MKEAPVLHGRYKKNTVNKFRKVCLVLFDVIINKETDPHVKYLKKRISRQYFLFTLELVVISNNYQKTVFLLLNSSLILNLFKKKKDRCSAFLLVCKALIFPGGSRMITVFIHISLVSTFLCLSPVVDAHSSTRLQPLFLFCNGWIDEKND